MYKCILNLENGKLHLLYSAWPEYVFLWSVIWAIFSQINLKKGRKIIDFNPTLHGGVIITPPPANFEASQLQQEGLVWSNLQMNWVTWVPIINYEQDPENATKFQQNLSHAICDRMIKNNPCKVGLIWLV